MGSSGTPGRPNGSSTGGVGGRAKLEAGRSVLSARLYSFEYRLSWHAESTVPQSTESQTRSLRATKDTKLTQAAKQGFDKKQETERKRQADSSGVGQAKGRPAAELWARTRAASAVIRLYPCSGDAG